MVVVVAKENGKTVFRQFVFVPVFLQLLRNTVNKRSGPGNKNGKKTETM